MRYIGKNGMACCPFHDDKNPSLKIYSDNYHCFGCQASGDAVNFTARLFSLSQYQAALKLCEDFRLNVTDRNLAVLPENLIFERRRFEEWDKSAFLAVNKYMKLLKKWREEHKPKNMDEPLHRLFAESLQEMGTTEYLLEILTVGSLDERRSLYENNMGYRLKLKWRGGLAFFASLAIILTIAQNYYLKALTFIGGLLAVGTSVFMLSGKYKFHFVFRYYVFRCFHWVNLHFYCYSYGYYCHLHGLLFSLVKAKPSFSAKNFPLKA